MSTLRVFGRAQAFDFPAGTSVLDIVMDQGVPISTSCGGVAACGLCRVTVHDGAQLLSAPNEKERGHLGDAGIGTGLRLACQSRVVGEGEVEIEVPIPEDVAARKQRKFTEQMRQRRSEQRQRGGSSSSQGARGSSRSGRSRNTR